MLVPREAPYSAIHLENMLAVTRAGAIVCRRRRRSTAGRETLEDALDSVLSRVLDHLGLPNALAEALGHRTSSFRNTPTRAALARRGGAE